MVEHRIENPSVTGSIPVRSNNLRKNNTLLAPRVNLLEDDGDKRVLNGARLPKCKVFSKGYCLSA